MRVDHRFVEKDIFMLHQEQDPRGRGRQGGGDTDRKPSNLRGATRDPSSVFFLGDDGRSRRGFGHYLGNQHNYGVDHRSG